MLTSLVSLSLQKIILIMGRQLICKCSKHDEFSKGCSFKIQKPSAKKILNETYELFLKYDRIMKRDVVICTACENHMRSYKDASDDEQPSKTSKNIYE